MGLTGCCRHIGKFNHHF